MTFEDFVADSGRTLEAGLAAAYGADLGSEASSAALAYGFENWGRLAGMDNPAGYLYRVGQSAARKQLKPQGYLPHTGAPDLPHFEPTLAPALEALSEPQRVAVVLVHSLGWTLKDTAEILDVNVSTVRTHIDRALGKLRTFLKVEHDAS